MYELRQPAAALAPYVDSYWFVHSTESDPVELSVDVFVDGRADLIFNFAAPYRRRVIGGKAREIAASNLDAQRLAPIRIEQRGVVRTTGVRFRLGGLGAYALTALADVTDRTPTPASVLGEDAVSLEAALRDEPDIDGQAKLLDAFFAGRVSTAPGFATFQRALAASVDSSGAASVAELADAAGVSTRQIDRLFARYLGFPPKVLGRVLRFQLALRRLMVDPEVTLAQLAIECGYFDQAHFIKDFRRFSGGVPRGYRGYYPPQGPNDFAPNVVVFLQDDSEVESFTGDVEHRDSRQAPEDEDDEALVRQGDEG